MAEGTGDFASLGEKTRKENILVKAFEDVTCVDDDPVEDYPTDELEVPENCRKNGSRMDNKRQQHNSVTSKFKKRKKGNRIPFK